MKSLKRADIGFHGKNVNGYYMFSCYAEGLGSYCYAGNGIRAAWPAQDKECAFLRALTPITDQASAAKAAADIRNSDRLDRLGRLGLLDRLDRLDLLKCRDSYLDLFRELAAIKD